MKKVRFKVNKNWTNKSGLQDNKHDVFCAGLFITRIMNQYTDNFDWDLKIQMPGLSGLETILVNRSLRSAFERGEFTVNGLATNRFERGARSALSFVKITGMRRKPPCSTPRDLFHSYPRKSHRTLILNHFYLLFW